jgi:hypothetical protein
MTIVANTTDADEHPEDRSLLNRRVWLAPICLCLVAVLHLYRVTTAGQTAWKGGGFGMFSTFDAENARFVRAFLLTEDGDRPIEIPAELEKRVAELKTAPNQAGLDTLAQRLAQRTWYDPVLDGEQLRALREVPAPSHPTPAPATPLVANKKSEQRQPIVPFRSVRVELWRFTMPPGTSRLEAGLLYTSIHPADADSTKEASR